MKGQNIKKCQQKELNLIGKTDKKTRNYILFFALQQKPRILNMQKWVIFYFRGQSETEYNRISTDFYYNG